MNESQFRLSMGFKPEERETPPLAAPPRISIQSTKGRVWDKEEGHFIPVKSDFFPPGS